MNTRDESKGYATMTSRFATPTDDGYEGEGDFLIIDPSYFFPEIPGEEEPPTHSMLGMAVHYVARGSLDGVYPPVDRACIIAAINVEGFPWMIQGVVLNPQGIFFDTLDHDATGKPGTWHYPWENLDDGPTADGDPDDDFEGLADLERPTADR